MADDPNKTKDVSNYGETSVLSVKDQTIEEIMKKTASIFKKKEKKIRKKPLKIETNIRHKKIIRSAKNLYIKKSKFDEAMKILNKPGPVYTRVQLTSNCHQKIVDLAGGHKYGLWQPLSLSKLQSEARICLQNQDWPNLTKLLIYLSSENTRSLQIGLSTTMQYVFLLLLHDPVAKKENFVNTFLENVVDCKNEHEKSIFLAKMFEIPKKKAKKLMGLKI